MKYDTVRVSTLQHTRAQRDMHMGYLTQKELADRWIISERTLEGWRSRGDYGPGYVKFGNRVRYPINEIERFERDNLHTIISNRSDRWAA